MSAILHQNPISLLQATKFQVSSPGVRNREREQRPQLTLFPYCMTWLVLVWDFTNWYCL
jgi:hypothetical protein